MQALVDAVNAALTTIKTYTDQRQGQHRRAQGRLLAELARRAAARRGVLGAVGADGSPGRTIGLQLTKDGKRHLRQGQVHAPRSQDDPAAGPAHGLRHAPPAPAPTASPAPPTTSPPSPGIAARLAAVAKVGLRHHDRHPSSRWPTARTPMAKDIQDRIDDWDLRLAKRKETLTQQFTAMETALSSLKNQSSWLAGADQLAAEARPDPAPAPRPARLPHAPGELSMSAASLRARYLGDSVATRSPQQLLVMLYDRLALDLERAAEGRRRRRRARRRASSCSTRRTSCSSCCRACRSTPGRAARGWPRSTTG